MAYTDGTALIDITGPEDADSGLAPVGPVDGVTRGLEADGCMSQYYTGKGRLMLGAIRPTPAFRDGFVGTRLTAPMFGCARSGMSSIGVRGGGPNALSMNPGPGPNTRSNIVSDITGHRLRGPLAAIQATVERSRVAG